MNERIRLLRENLGLTRASFGERIGVSGDVINNLERGRVDVKEHIAKLICKEFNVSEEWLRNGKEPIFIEVDTFSLDAFFEQRKATELEREIIKAYLDLDPDVRKQVIEHFKARLGRFTDSNNSNIKAFRAARSEDNTPPEIVDMSEAELEALRNAPNVTSDEDL